MGCELGSKKHKHGLIGYLAREAVWFIYILFKSRHSRISCQSPTEFEEWAKEFSKNNDDKIIECCLGLKKSILEKIIWPTKDKNLYNKGSISKVRVHDSDSHLLSLKNRLKN